jgi:hypothetical protein
VSIYDQPEDAHVPSGTTYDDIGLTYDVGTYTPPVAPTPVDPLTPSPAITLNFSDVATPTALVRAIGIEGNRIYPRTMQGYPDPPFLLCLDYQKISQEILLATSVGANYWNVTRNFDNSGLYAHDVGATVLHSTTAFNYTVVNHHIHDPSVDWHTQYMDDFRHADPARHTIQRVTDGVESGSLRAGPPLPSLPGDVAQQGTSAYCIASDHIHPRESFSDIVINAIPAGVICLVPRQKKTNFYWLTDTVATPSLHYPAPYAPSGVSVSLSMLGQPSESNLTFGGRRGAPVPSVDPQITGLNH